MEDSSRIKIIVFAFDRREISVVYNTLHVWIPVNSLISPLNHEIIDLISDNNRSRSFTLSGNSNMQVSAMVGSGQTPNSCINDWLLIGCARVADKIPLQTICEDRICGGTFSAEIGLIEKTVTSKNFFWLSGF